MRGSLLLVALVLAPLSGCATPPEAPATVPSDGPPPDASPPRPLRTFEARFSPEHALLLAKEQTRTENGTVRYRIPGTPGNDEAAALISGRLAEAGIDARYQWFNATYGCRTVPMHNVVGVRPGSGPGTIYLGAHYDTRPIADKEEAPEDRVKPIEGANDGASGVAVLLELARALEGANLTPTLVFVFFDGEDGGGYLGETCTKWILGSTAFAEALTASEVARARSMVLVDLVGGANLTLRRELFSAEKPHRAVQDRLYAIGGGLGLPAWTNESGIHVLDDHVPFARRGIPSVDLIHLRSERGGTPADPFPEVHHRLSDTFENLRAESLGQVGAVLERWLREDYSA